jgi:hypothetical protein
MLLLRLICLVERMLLSIGTASDFSCQNFLIFYSEF